MTGYIPEEHVTDYILLLLNEDSIACIERQIDEQLSVGKEEVASFEDGNEIEEIE